MSERWKPEKDETFWWFDFDGRVFQRTYHCDSFDFKFMAFGNMFKTEEEAKSAVEKVKALLLSLQEPVTAFPQLPKLTAKVFDREDCPEWAKYAAVDRGGKAFWFASHPARSNEAWLHLTYKRISGDLFDASDWQNSLIERLAKALPDWCKVGEWVYSPCGCDPTKGTYFKITQIDDVCIIGGNDICHVDNAVRARLRPYNAEEMRGLTGKILTDKDGNMNIIEGWSMDINKVRFDHLYYSAEKLLDSFTIDGRPCGVLEHLNENLEWEE